MELRRKFKVGDEVMIEGHRVTLVRPYSDIDGGWIVDPPIGDPPMQSWNEDAMEVIER